jgi:hypothetical protein
LLLKALELVDVDASRLAFLFILKGINMTKTFNGDQKLKLITIINEGCQVMHEVDTLTGGLNDTIKAIAEELEIKPAVLKKAIKLAHKAEFGKAKQDHEQLETILETVGKTL